MKPPTYLTMVLLLMILLNITPANGQSGRQRTPPQPVQTSPNNSETFPHPPTISRRPAPTTSKDEELGANDTISIEATLVNVPVIVSDRQGRYISGLSQREFTLYDNGVAQPIAFFDAGAQPLNIALLLDTSKSTREVLDDIKTAAQEFLTTLRPQDKATIIGFDSDINILTPLTGDHRRLEDAIYQARIGYYVGTKLNDAVEEASRVLKTASGRKAIVLLTDGKDHGSQLSADELLSDLTESDALIYSIFYNTENGRFNNQRRPIFNNPYPRWPNERRQERRQERRAQKNEEAAQFLEDISETTAGRAYRSEVTDLRQTFNLIAEELRHQYILGFYPDDNSPDSHRIKVQISRHDLAVRARPNYRMAEPNHSNLPVLR